MNAYGPQNGATIGTITFDFSDASSYAINLVGGVNVRDFYQGSYANSTSANYVENAYTYANITGGAAGTNSSNGDFGTYVFDEQDFSIAPFAAGKTLTGIQPSSPNSNGINSGNGTGTPILLGLTVAQQGTVVTNVPEPASIAMLATACFMLIGFGRRNRVHFRSLV